MNIANRAVLESIHTRYAQVLELGENGRRLIANPASAGPLREEYERKHFVSVPGVLPPLHYSDLVKALLPLLSPLAKRLSMSHEEDTDGNLSGGFRFARLDPELSGHPEITEKLQEVLHRLGLAESASRLAADVTPLIRFIAGRVSFRRAYFYLYREGDYISVHDDRQVGERVDVQFPISFETRAGIRVLEDGFLRMRYDDRGAMNILGPAVWHDVPPILAARPGIEPIRFNMGYRFMPDE